MDKRILVINPGSTSTKLALFQGEQKLFDAAVRHSKRGPEPLLLGHGTGGFPPDCH